MNAQEAIELWINNDYGLYQMYVEEYRVMIEGGEHRDEVVNELSRVIEELLDERMEGVTDPILQDIFSSAIGTVDFRELASDLLEEL